MDDDLKLLEAAKIKARELVEKEPSKANLDAFDKASRMLAECLEGGKEPSFENRLEAHKYLKRMGYKISQGKFYQNCKNGMCRMQADGSVTEADLKSYVAKAGIIKPDQLAYEVESSDLQRKKQKQEVEILAAKLEDMTIKLDVLKKNLLDRNQVETEQAIKAGALMAGLNHVFRNMARDAIQLVEGNFKHTQALVALLIGKTEDLFDEFARMEEIEIIVKGEK